MRRKQDDPNQILIDWANPAPAAPAAPAAATLGEDAPTRKTDEPNETRLETTSLSPLIHHLPWDFATTFPELTDEVIDSGVLHVTDREPDNLKALHNDYARQCLAVIRRLAKVMDARRRGIDPNTGTQPRTHANRERLRRYLADEPDRIERNYRILIETYESAFGAEAADGFDKCLRARHAGVEVLREEPSAEPFMSTGRGSARMPVPKALPTRAVAGVFGFDNYGQPVRPGPDEVRAITEQHVKKLVALLYGSE